jgi:hypothetical protein
LAEEVLLAHPAVAKAIAFSIPDKRLGEDIGAAVVFRVGQSATESYLRELVATELSALKVRRRILILSELPKGAVGKLDRIRAAARLGLTDADPLPARTQAAQTVARLGLGYIAEKIRFNVSLLRAVKMDELPAFSGTMLVDQRETCAQGHST